MHPVNSGVMLGLRCCDAGKLSRHPTNYEDTKLKDGGVHIMISRLIMAVAVALFFTPAALVCAQEHPEHPKKTSEHPKKGAEHPEKAGAEKEVSTTDISAGIKKNIDTQSKKSSDGKFHVKYEGQDLALDLIKVHDDRLQDLGGGKYFACVDMKGADGKTYDIDFFLTGEPDKMKVTETSVHKIDGKPLYNWKEENGKWHKVSTG
jgi:hypothetical protein